MTGGGAAFLRFDRQARLPEIGVAGQMRLGRGRAEVRGGRALERDIETEYLARAGVGVRIVLFLFCGFAFLALSYRFRAGRQPAGE